MKRGREEKPSQPQAYTSDVPFHPIFSLKFQRNKTLRKTVTGNAATSHLFYLLHSKLILQINKTSHPTNITYTLPS